MKYIIIVCLLCLGACTDRARQRKEIGVAASSIWSAAAALQQNPEIAHDVLPAIQAEAAAICRAVGGRPAEAPPENTEVPHD